MLNGALVSKVGVDLAENEPFSRTSDALLQNGSFSPTVLPFLTKCLGRPGVPQAASADPDLRKRAARTLGEFDRHPILGSLTKVKLISLFYTFTSAEFGPFSAVSTRIFASTYSFFSIFRDLQDVYSFAPLGS